MNARHWRLLMWWGFFVIAATFCFCKFAAKLTLARTARSFRACTSSGVRKCHQLTTTQWKPKGDHCGDENALKAEHLLNTIDCWIVGCQVDSSVFLVRTLELTQKNIQQVDSAEGTFEYALRIRFLLPAVIFIWVSPRAGKFRTTLPVTQFHCRPATMKRNKL